MYHLDIQIPIDVEILPSLQICPVLGAVSQELFVSNLVVEAVFGQIFANILTIYRDPQ